MTVSLTYDQAVSRVTVDADGLAIVDTFGRTVSNGWGSADTGQAWTTAGGVAADYSVNGSRGVHSVPAVNSARRTLVGSGIYDVDITCNIVVGVLATGEAIIAGLLARYIDTGNHYVFEMQCETNQQIELRILRFRTGSPTALASVIHPTETHQVGDNFMVRLQVAGPVVRAKLWHTPDVEPAGWDITVTDSAPLVKPGAVGCRSALNTGNTNTLPVVITYNDFVARLVPHPPLIERSADNETWTTVRGAGQLLPVNGAASVLDYEFGPDVPNTWRINTTPVSTVPMAGRIVTPGTTSAGTLDASSLNVDMGGRALRLTLTVDRPENIGSISFRLGVAGLTNTIRWLFNAGSSSTPMCRPHERFQVLLQLAEVDSAFGTITMSAAGVPSVTSGFTDARLQVSDDGVPITVILHKVELVPVALPGAFVSVTFDDSLIETHANAYPKMQTLGFRGTDFVIVSTLGDGSHATLADLQTRAAAGWEIAGHSHTTAHGSGGLSALTAAQARADLAALYTWLDTNFPHPSKRYAHAYPEGKWTETTDGHRLERLVREAGFFAARTTLTGSGSEVNTAVRIASPRPPHPFRIYGMSGISSLASGQRVPANLIAAGGMLDKVAAHGGWLNLVFHRVVAGAPASTNEVSQTDFDAIMDGLAARGITVLPVREVIDQLAATTTPTIDGVWLKSTVDPTRNRKVTVTDYSDVERPARTGLFTVKGRRLPVAVSDVRGGRQWTLDVVTVDQTEADAIDELLDRGDVILVHTPALENLPSGYVTVGDFTRRRPSRRAVRRIMSLPMTEVAAPEA